MVTIITTLVYRQAGYTLVEHYKLLLCIERDQNTDIYVHLSCTEIALFDQSAVRLVASLLHRKTDESRAASPRTSFDSHEISISGEKESEIEKEAVSYTHLDVYKRQSPEIEIS